MFTYADPEACPVCRAPIPYGAVHCDACDTTLSGSPVSESLWRTLTHADSLVAELLRLAANSTEARTAAATVAAPAVAAPSMTSGLPPLPQPASSGHPQRRTGSGLTLASVPKILLGLGAGCLLVAAIVFLVVAWASFGQAGRTLTLLGVTAAAGGATAAMIRANLRAGAESLATLTLGLLALDIVGANSAGWFGQLSGNDLALPLGGALAVAGLGLAYVVRHGTALPRLVAAELLGALGVAIAMTWTLNLEIGSDRFGLVFIPVTLALVALALATRHLALSFAAGALIGVAGLWWLALLIHGLGTLLEEEATLAAVWGGFGAWELLAAAAIMLLPIPIGLRREWQVLGAAVAVGLVTFVVTFPAFDEGTSMTGLVSLAVVAAGVAAGLRFVPAWRTTVAVPVLCATTHLLILSLNLMGAGSAALQSEDTWSVGPFDALPGAGLAWHHPLLLVPVALGSLFGAWALVRVLTQVPLRPLLPSMALLGLAPLALVPSLYAVPRALAVGVLLAALTIHLLVVRWTASDRWLRGTAIGVAALTACTALGASLASAGLTATTTALLLAAALVLSSSRDLVTRRVGEVLTPALCAGFLWTALHLLSAEPNLRAPVILAAIGLWAILRPVWWVETAVLLTGLTTVSSALAMPGGSDQTWLAVDLTVAGVLVTISALVNPSRRVLGWFGLALLTLAQWVRMEELGVSTVEAYTLPLAVVLLAIGLIRMQRSDVSSTRALTSGLVLAITPSLLVALAEPLSLRAVLVGAGCAALIATGAALRWSSPLVAGAVAGALLVLREATYAQVLPQWVTLALIGVILVTVGATWERRLNEVRLAAGYVRRLR